MEYKIEVCYSLCRYYVVTISPRAWKNCIVYQEDDWCGLHSHLTSGHACSHFSISDQVNFQFPASVFLNSHC